MKVIRYIDLGYINLPMLHAIEEAIAYKGIPTVMLWIASPRTASIGYFQSVHKELNVEECNKLNVMISRRPCGGGAAYFDERELYYSVITKNKDEILPTNYLAAFKKALEALIYALEKFGLKATYTGKNDVIVNGRKISGNSQTNKHDAKIVHGTFLLDFDYDISSRVLKIPVQKVADKGILADTVKKILIERVTTVKRELGREVEKEEAKRYLIEGFEYALDAKLVEGKLLSEEMKLAEKYVEKYMDPNFIYKR